MKLISLENMKRLEAAANAGGYTYEKMMAKAGQNLAHVIHERYFWSDRNQIIGLVGGGNNGGDALVALAELQKMGWTCSAILLKSDSQPEILLTDFQKNGGILLGLGAQKGEQILNEVDKARVVLDGVFGTGFKLPVRSPYKEILELVKKKCTGKTIVAVDCPSGVDCTTGEASPETLKADLTISIEAVKDGLLKFPAFDLCGEIVSVDLEIPAKFQKEVPCDDIVIDAEYVKKSLPDRPSNSHKGTFGHVLICGGSVNYVGAPVLAGKSAYRVGAGLVECAVPERIYEAIAGNNLESIWLLLEDEDGVIAEAASLTLTPRLEHANCLLIGPGIGREESTQKFFNRVLFESPTGPQTANIGFLPNAVKKTVDKNHPFPPIVIDADALTLLSRTSDWHSKLKGRAVLTPHPGEMATLTGLSTEEIQQDRMAVARQYASKWQQVVVLKGALTVVASPDGKIAVLPFANSALAKAGTGDVLAGMIAGLIAQGMLLFEAAVSGVWLHAQAGALAARKLGSEKSLIASDIIGAIPEIFGKL